MSDQGGQLTNEQTYPLRIPDIQLGEGNDTPMHDVVNFVLIQHGNSFVREKEYPRNFGKLVMMMKREKIKCKRDEALLRMVEGKV